MDEKTGILFDCKACDSNKFIKWLITYMVHHPTEHKIFDIFEMGYKRIKEINLRKLFLIDEDNLLFSVS